MILLICQHCKRPNAAESKFCSDCGTELRRQECAACGALNDIDALQCHACGTALQAPAPAAAAAPGRTTEVALTAPPTDLPTLAPATGQLWAASGPASMPGQHRQAWLVPFFTGLAGVGTLALAVLSIVFWPASAPSPTPEAAAARPVAAGTAAVVRSPAADAAADAAAAAAARLLITNGGSASPASRVGTDASGSTAPVAIVPAKPAFERDATPPARPPAVVEIRSTPPAAVIAPATAPLRVPVPTQRADRPSPVAPLNAETAPAARGAPVPAVRAAPGAAPAFEPRRPAPDARPKPPPSVLPRECTAAMEALALCGTISKPSGS